MALPYPLAHLFLKTIKILIVLLAFWFIPQITFAHSELVSSSPKPGETVGADLQEIRLVFSEPVSEESNILLFTDDFTPVPITPYHDALYPTNIYAPVSNLKSGNYIVQWTAVSPDNHQIEGSYQFRVNNSTQLLNPTTLFAILSLLIFASIILIWRRKHKNGRSRPKPHH